MDITPADCVVRMGAGERIGEKLAGLLDPIDPASLHEYRLPAKSDVELHYHDFDEYWLFTSGTPLITLRSPDGKLEKFQLGPGDMIACVRGVSHTLYADHELIYFQFTSVVREGARPGHLTD